MSDELLAELAIRTGKDRSQDWVATVASTSPLEVNFRGERMAAVNAVANTLLVVGDSVRVTQFGQQLVVAGVMSQLPALAVVQAYTAGAQNCTVVSGDDVFDAQIIGSGWTPAAGDRVGILWTSAGPFAAKRGGPVASPAPPPLPPDNMNATAGPDLPAPKPPSASTQQAVVYAAQTASYSGFGGLYTGGQGRYWLYAGNSPDVEFYSGHWFYGDRLAAVRGVTVTKFEVFLHRATSVGPSGAVTVPLVMHTSRTRPSTQPTDSVATYFVDTIALKPGQAGWFTLPTNWGQLIAGNAYQGLGIVTLYGTDQWKALLGIDHPTSAYRDALSGAMRFTYKRS